MQPSSTPTIIEFASAFAFDDTVQRLSEAIAGAGMQLFAQIDHAANARQVGLHMPATVVMIYGKAEGGTPIMLAAPQSALDLPLHVLVREDADGKTTIAFRPMAALLQADGVPAALAARLEPAQQLLLKVIEHGGASG
jgi:uncharacterized protein (DUF302 family)